MCGRLRLALRYRRHGANLFVAATLISRRAADALSKSPDRESWSSTVDRDTLALWDRSTKLMATLATRLRIAPQSRYDAKTAARRAGATVTMTPPWEPHCGQEDQAKE
jgi:hypothetical protein